MVYYILKTEDMITYLGYKIKNEDKVSTGPNGTYATAKGFIKDKSKGVEIEEIYIGKVETFDKEYDTLIEVPFIPNYKLDKEEKLLVKVPENIRKYLLSLTYINKTFERVEDFKGFFNPKRFTNPLMIGNNIFYRPQSFNNIANAEYYIITNPPGEIGRNASNALYGIVKLETGLEYINDLTKYYDKYLDDFDNPICVYIQNINSQVPAMVLRDFGIEDLRIVEMDFHREKIPVLKLGEDFPLVEMVFPANLGFRAFERIETLLKRKSKYKNNQLPKHFEVLDITDVLWKDNDIASDIKPGKKLKVSMQGFLPIPFVPDIDIPSYNSLRKLAKLEPSCKLLVEDESVSISYTFIINSTLGEGIYFSYFTNRVFKRAIKKKKI